ncbi:NFACT RNA binding domain-containing protein [Peptoniphilus equinus]|uniref:Rqc2 homolog RqcH n=1 Tax=Peptoniphilus equinus TaxID=3016343 RepID=A0ABY7QUE5_9FIRM|nr:NFACT RNA binding domain-containing protein [Peptoniphilus equinus]WBW50405.1 NFACT RNA binding domain-containing protein [Peptoniphilus equinus]
MAYDGIMLRGITHDLQSLINKKIEKIYQVSKDKIILVFRIDGEKKKLLLDVSSATPRIHFTDVDFNNPTTPPTFCMLLRKHLEGFKVTGVEQVAMDRILFIHVMSRDELQFEVARTLVVELMGKHSNIILIDGKTHVILDAIRRVNRTMSSVREVLPGLTYTNDDIVRGTNPLDDNAFEALEITSKSLRQSFITSFMGLGPIVIREMCCRASLDEDRPLNSLSADELTALRTAFYDVLAPVKAHHYTPLLIEENGTLIDYAPLELTHYNDASKTGFDNLSILADTYYARKITHQVVKDKSSELHKKLSSLLKREENKLSKQLKEFEQAQAREKYKIYADLIASNLYRIEEGADEVTVENFFDAMQPITIKLDPLLSPQGNANKYYKRYGKLKNAYNKLTEELDHTKNSIAYLHSVVSNLSLAGTAEDVDAIKDELMDMGYLKKQSAKKKSKASKYLEVPVSDGICYVGKNNHQNDFLTHKFAHKDDLWFHVQNAPGSHVILKAAQYTDDNLKAAAALAAAHSGQNRSNNVPVDYTFVKYVKRHPAKMPGLVTYTNFKTIIVKQ